MAQSIGGCDTALAVKKRGMCPEISLRTRRDEARKLLVNGTDLSDKKKTDEIWQVENLTFREVAIEWHATNNKWSKDHNACVLKDLEGNLFPAIGKHNITELKTRDFLVLVNYVSPVDQRSISRHPCGRYRQTVNRWKVLSTPIVASKMRTPHLVPLSRQATYSP